MSWRNRSRYSHFAPYVSVAKRQAQAAREVEKRKKSGHAISPVKIVGTKITRTFWGNAWCTNLESYSDYSNRLPRGRTYVRNGSVVDLQIQQGKITALVSGSSLYKIEISISRLPAETWNAVKRKCAGQISTLVELLQGKLSKSVMDTVCQRNGGLFPKPSEIKMACSCPDWAGVCKHLAATMYGVGARLDDQPELLFKLRQVDHLELITGASDFGAAPVSGRKGKTGLASDDLADMFGIEIAEGDDTPPPAPVKAGRGKKRTPAAATPPEAATPPVNARQNGNPPGGRKKRAAPPQAAAAPPVPEPAPLPPAPVKQRGRATPTPPIEIAAMIAKAAARRTRPQATPELPQPATGRKRAGKPASSAKSAVPPPAPAKKRTRASPARSRRPA